MLFQDEIAPTGEISATTGEPLRENVDRSSRLGLELSGAWAPLTRLQVHGDLSLMRARMESYTEPYSGTVVTDVPPMLTPAVTSNHGVTVTLPRALALTVDGRYVGESHLTNLGDDLKLPARYMVDSGLEWGTRHGTLAVGVRNLGDVDAYGSGYAYDGVRYFYVEAPRSVYVSLSARF
jgi:iron complex outermembrane receptor protein